MQRETRRWVLKAEADLACARQLIGTAPPLNDVICFHCQQAAEKYLKALLQEWGAAVPRVHDLEKLIAMVSTHDPTMPTFRRGMLFLTQFAVEHRYPDANATRRQLRAAIVWAERVRAEARKRLGLD